MKGFVAADSTEITSRGWQGPTESGQPGGAERHSVGATDRGGLARSAGSISIASYLPPAVPGMAEGGRAGEDSANAG
jgi:hypothetical protein